MNIDFTPLSQPVTKEDMKAYEASPEAGIHPRFKKKILFTIAPIAIVFVSFLVIQTILSDGIRLSPLVFPIIVGGIIITVYIFISHNRKKYLAQLLKFAYTNKARLIVDDMLPNYAGAIFDEGDGRIINEALVFSDGKEIGNYQYSKGSGKNRRTYKWGYMRVKLVRRLPHMLLDSKKNNYFGGAISNLPTSFSKNQTIKLEGNFNNYFTLYSPANYGQDAFYVFTPDVMAALIDYGEHYDMEVIDDYLYFYTNKHLPLNSEQSLRQAFEVINKISTELIDQTDYYADVRVGDRSANIIAEPGRRLKSRRTVTIAVIIFIIIFFWHASTILRTFLSYN